MTDQDLFIDDEAALQLTRRALRNPCRNCFYAEAVIDCSATHKALCRRCWQKEGNVIVRALLGTSALAEIVRHVDVSRFPLPMRMFPTKKVDGDPLVEHLFAEMLVRDRDQERWIAVSSDNKVRLDATEGYIVDQLHSITLMMVKHELDEQFRFRDGLPFDPHRPL